MALKFNSRGLLPQGIHVTSGKEFLARFLFNDYRKGFRGSLINIFDWAKHKQASIIFIGGSFVSKVERPHDLDCLVVFPHEDAIPSKPEMLTIESTKIDIQFCAESDRQLVDAFIHLFTHTRGHKLVGIVQIDLYGHGEPWQIVFEPSNDHYEIIKRAYVNRYYIDHYEPNGVLVSIHGISSNASWNAEIAPVASSHNWVFAPFLYCENNSSLLLFSMKKRKEVIERFREWIYDIQSRYPYYISIIAHSFGTYILASYISGFDEFLPIQLNAVILTGSIINQDFDWENHRGVRVARVLNEIAPHDQWVKYMPKLKWFHADPLYGNSGVVGFRKHCKIVMQMSNDIFDHNNVIKRDVVEHHWMPFLMANSDAYRTEGEIYLLKKHRKNKR